MYLTNSKRLTTDKIKILKFRLPFVTIGWKFHNFYFIFIKIIISKLYLLNFINWYFIITIFFFYNLSWHWQLWVKKVRHFDFKQQYTETLNNNTYNNNVRIHASFPSLAVLILLSLSMNHKIDDSTETKFRKSGVSMSFWFFIIFIINLFNIGSFIC